MLLKRTLLIHLDDLYQTKVPDIETKVQPPKALPLSLVAPPKPMPESSSPGLFGYKSEEFVEIEMAHAH